MGNKIIIFTDEQLDDYQDVTFFTRKEIMRIFRRFRELDRSTVPKTMTGTEAQTIKVRRELLEKMPELKENPYSRRICEAFSNDGSGDLTFDDFLDMFSVFHEQCPRELKLLHAFKIYDYDGDNYIGQDDLQKAVVALTKNQLTADEVALVCEKVLEESDVDDDGKLSSMEFENVMSRSSEFLGLTVAYFAISGLDLLQSIDVLQAEKDAIIDWIYSLQVLPSNDGSNMDKCGFRGSTTINVTKKLQEKNEEEEEAKEKNRESDCRCSEPILYDCGHIAMTYTGLASLVVLGDDLSRVNKNAILAGLRALQLADGSFKAMVDGSENDMRFVYCAAAISYILQDWRGMDVTLTLKYIRNSLAFDHAIGHGFYSESHGGLTFCAIATLNMMGKLESTFDDRQRRRLLRWCVFRQQSGFHGRPNKQEDTCYSFWVGATLKMLDAFHLTDSKQNRDFILSTQNPTVGGMSKYPEPDSNPDPLHTYTGLGGLSLLGEEQLLPINPALNISVRATEHLHRLHESWEKLQVR